MISSGDIDKTQSLFLKLAAHDNAERCHQIVSAQAQKGSLNFELLLLVM